VEVGVIPSFIIVTGVVYLHSTQFLSAVGVVDGDTIVLYRTALLSNRLHQAGLALDVIKPLDFCLRVGILLSRQLDVNKPLQKGEVVFR
jgi:hypothetical protein